MGGVEVRGGGVELRGGGVEVRGGEVVVGGGRMGGGGVEVRGGEVVVGEGGGGVEVGGEWEGTSSVEKEGTIAEEGTEPTVMDDEVGQDSIEGIGRG